MPLMLPISDSLLVLLSVVCCLLFLLALLFLGFQFVFRLNCLLWLLCEIVVIRDSFSIIIVYCFLTDFPALIHDTWAGERLLNILFTDLHRLQFDVQVHL